MSSSIKTISSLQAEGLVSKDALPALEEVASRYAIGITPIMRSVIGAPGDSVGLQFVPTAAELNVTGEERADPIGDERFTPLKGITHRYPDRLLLKITHMCPVYCRFCFRRNKVGPGEGFLSDDELAAALDYIRRHDEIWEVIFTGGDPLIMPARKIRPIMMDLKRMDHVKVVRFHTRIPVVDPARITDGMIDALRSASTTWLVIHTNHAMEFTREARHAIARLADAGLPLLSQSVLLRGVNDTPQDLEHLFRTLVENRIKPYYLHHGDLAEGTSHFRTTLAEGQDLMKRIRGRVSGICQPVYILDIPGGYGKVPVGPVYVRYEQGAHFVEDPWGVEHAYPPSATR